MSNYSKGNNDNNSTCYKRTAVHTYQQQLTDWTALVD